MAQPELKPTAVFTGTIKEIKNIPTELKDTAIAVIETKGNPDLPEGASPIAWYPINSELAQLGVEVVIAKFVQSVGENGGSRTTWKVTPKNA